MVKSTTAPTGLNGSQDSDTVRCIKNCTRTAQVCAETLHYGLQKGFGKLGKQAALLQSCIEACQLSVSFMIRDSEFHHQACELCFEVCEACATECERYEEDEIFKRCAEACRRSAESCRGMAGMTVRIAQDKFEGRSAMRI